jgi:hypothetical protein
MKIGDVVKDPDVKRSLAYLAISLTVSLVKTAIEHFREQRA